MRTFTNLISNEGSFTDLANNTSTANVTRGKQLINDEHRYLLQKFFDNERTVQITTVGAQELTLTGTLAVNAVSATLNSAWAYPTCQQLVNFSSGEQRLVLFTLNSTAITWTGGLTETATATIDTVGVQEYNIPANISKIINDTITIGQLRYSPAPVQTRAEWDQLNTLPYTSDIPNYYFIYNGKLCIYPIPSTTGNIITFNYKARVIDMTFSDYSTGTLAAAGMTVGSVTVNGTTTSWLTGGGYPSGVDITHLNLYIRANPSTGGDGIWYQIRQFTDEDTLVLVNPVVSAPNITTATTYTIGQMPLLSEDFHDMLIYAALMIYYSSVVENANKYKQYKDLYDKKLKLLEDYAGTKAVNVDLGVQPNQQNPNLFLYSNQ
jgi:hypothetical protein